MPCRYDTISYNGFVFTGFPKASLHSDSVYAEDGITVKYIRHQLEVEFIVTNELLRIYNGKLFDGVDTEMDYIRQCLSVSNRSLIFSYRGAGRGETANQWSSELAIDLTDTADFQGLQQFGYGCKPEVIKWEPIANNTAVRCTWRCSFNTSKAFIPSLKYSENIRGDDGELLNSRVKPPATHAAGESWDWELMVLSFTEEQEVDIDEKGLLVSTLKGVIEFSNPKVTTRSVAWAQPSQGGVTDRMEDWVLNPSNRRSIVQDLQQYFEPYQPLGFTRKQRYNFNKSTHQLEYVIVDTEIENAQAQFPRIIQYTASHEVSSDLLNEDVLSGSGFLTWANNFEGSFTIAPGYWMGWAWIAMMVIVRQRIQRSIPYEPLADPFDTIKDDKDALLTPAAQVVQNPDAVGRKKVVPKHLLHGIRVKEYIHERKVDISLKYMVLTTLNNLFRGTGLFANVYSMFAEDGIVPLTYNVNSPTNYGRTPAGHPSTWDPVTKQLHHEHLRYFLKNMSQNTLGYSGLGFADYNLIFDPDHQNLGTISFDKNLDPGASSSKTLTWAQGPNPFNDTQEANIYAAYRRHRHYQDHPAFLNTYRGNENYTDVNPATLTQQPKETTVNPPNYSSGSTQQYPGGQSTTSSFLNLGDKAHTWIDYKTEFELIEHSNSSYLATIQNRDPARLKTDNETVPILRNVPSFTINGETQDVGAVPFQPVKYTDHKIIAHGKPVYYVRFTGSAIRAGYQIPMPVVYGLVNVAAPPPTSNATALSAFRVGKQYWRQRQITKSGDIPIFGAEWSLTYALDGNPTNANIGFHHSRSSEYV